MSRGREGLGVDIVDIDLKNNDNKNHLPLPRVSQIIQFLKCKKAFRLFWVTCQVVGQVTQLAVKLYPVVVKHTYDSVEQCIFIILDSF